MRLKEIIAEWLYLKNNLPCSFGLQEFEGQDSNVRDFCHRQAAEMIPKLIASYLGCNGLLDKVVRGSIKSYIIAHGNKLNLTNYSSLTKRITSNIRSMVYSEKQNAVVKRLWS